MMLARLRDSSSKTRVNALTASAGSLRTQRLASRSSAGAKAGRISLGFTRDWLSAFARSAKADLAAPAKEYGERSIGCLSLENERCVRQFFFPTSAILPTTPATR